MNEFELIDRFFTRGMASGELVRQGIGDDCALLDCGERLLAVTTDLLVEGRHFLPGADAECLGHKALAVNLSDLAAAGATPRAFQLALALPRADEDWLAAFARGLFALADEHGCALIGGDTTRAPQLAQASARIDGPLTICITALGDLPVQFARTRSGARLGDDLWVSGTLGDARAALAWRRGEGVTFSPSNLTACSERMDRPQPRVVLGVALRGIATAAIDLSDGLFGDLGHILKRSRVGAFIEWERIPRSAAVRSLPLDLQQRFALAGGDDYELLFTAAPDRRADVDAAAAAASSVVSRIGSIVDGGELAVRDARGRPVQIADRAFDHFTE